MEHLAKLIKYRRLELKLTQEEVSEGICTPSYYSRIENSRLTANEELYTLLLERLGINQDDHLSSLKEENEWLENVYKANFDKRIQLTKYKGTFQLIDNTISTLHVKAQIVYVRELINQRKFSEANIKLLNIRKVMESTDQQDRLQFMFLHNAVTLYFFDKRYQEAINLIESYGLFEPERYIENPLELGSFYYMTSLLYHKMHKLNRSMKFIKKSTDFFQVAFYIEGLIKCKIMEGILYNNLNNFNASLTQYNTAQYMVNYLNEDVQSLYRQMISHNLGYLHENNGDYIAAIEHYKESLENEKQSPVTHINLIRCFLKTNSKEKALYYFSKASQLPTTRLQKEDYYQIEILKRIVVDYEPPSAKIDDIVKLSLSYFEKNHLLNLFLYYSEVFSAYYEKHQLYKKSSVILKNALKVSERKRKG